jgi:hypothetical protein
MASAWRATARGFQFFWPNGVEVTALTAALALPTNPVDALRAQHRAAGITIDAHTGFPRWDVRPPDYDQVVCCLIGRQESTSPPPSAIPRRPGKRPHEALRAPVCDLADVDDHPVADV